jgi:hypothetical protein
MRRRAQLQLTSNLSLPLLAKDFGITNGASGSNAGSSSVAGALPALAASSSLRNRSSSSSASGACCNMRRELLLWVVTLALARGAPMKKACACCSRDAAASSRISRCIVRKRSEAHQGAPTVEYHPEVSCSSSSSSSGHTCVIAQQACADQKSTQYTVDPFIGIRLLLYCKSVLLAALACATAHHYQTNYSLQLLV